MSAVHFGLVLTVTNGVALGVVITRCYGIIFLWWCPPYAYSYSQLPESENPVNRLIHFIELIVLRTYFF